MNHINLTIKLDGQQKNNIFSREYKKEKCVGIPKVS